MKIKASLFKTFLEAVSRIDAEPRLTINKSGISTVSVDPAHVALVRANIPISPDLDVSEDLNVCVDAKKLLSFIKNYKGTDVLDITFDGGKTKINGGMLKFSTNQLTDKSPPKIPNITMPAFGTANVKELKGIISAKVSDNVRFAINAQKLTVSLENETDSISASYETECTGEYAAAYPTDYIISALISDEVNIEFGSDIPCRIKPVIDGMAIVYLIAPRIEQD